jgi:sulfatase maturation enzyme AslB (radical SAM superfamily)
MNPEFLGMLADALGAGFEVLVLTNAMQPMQRPQMQRGLLELNDTYGAKLTLRVSLDHHTKALHETERGAGTWDKSIEGLDWLAANGLRMAIAGRTCWGEDEASARAGFAKLFAERGWPIDAQDPTALTLFPEMDGAHDVPEITTACWSILNKSPRDVMCASSRMVVKRKAAAAPVVLPCTLLPYDSAFEMGATLQAASAADCGMFAHGAVKLCHPHCARFCVLGGGSCS